jgi:hypothetical protein
MKLDMREGKTHALGFKQQIVVARNLSVRILPF